MFLPLKQSEVLDLPHSWFSGPRGTRRVPGRPSEQRVLCLGCVSCPAGYWRLEWPSLVFLFHLLHFLLSFPFCIIAGGSRSCCGAGEAPTRDRAWSSLEGGFGDGRSSGGGVTDAASLIQDVHSLGKPAALIQRNLLQGSQSAGRPNGTRRGAHRLHQPRPGKWVVRFTSCVT